MVLEKLPAMSPAKTFAFMKQRENKKEQREVRKVKSGTRGFLDRGECVYPDMVDLNPAKRNT